MSSISIMQGRLSPSEAGRFQFFPTEWAAEFSRAKTLDFDGLCWFLDVDKPNFDPLQDIWFNEKMLSTIDQEINVLPIRSVDSGLVEFPKLQTLLPIIASRLTNGTICIPLLETKAPKSTSEWSKMSSELQSLAKIAKKNKLQIALETELPADKLLLFLDKIQMENVGVCYDTGNTASYGFDGPEEIRKLGKRIFEVHLKDRQLGSSQSVLLGNGNANLPDCFRALKEVGYNRNFTLQAWRGNNYLEDAKSQLAFVKKVLNQINYV